MDGLISSLQYNRHNAFSYVEKNDEDKSKGNKNSPNQTSSTEKTTTSSALSLNHYTVTERDNKEGNGNGNGGNFHSSQQNKVGDANNIEGNKFGTTLGDMMVGSAIVDAALKVVQSVRDTMLEELQKSLGVPTDSLPTNSNITMGSMNLSFESLIVSGNITQSVSVNISLSQSLVEQQMPTLLELLGVSTESNDQSSAGTLNSFSFNMSASSTHINMNSNGMNANFSSTNIQLNMNMTHIQGGVQVSPNISLIDPLVIDLGGEGVELSSDHFEFDLDSDGKSDQVSHPTGNSGFLALDKNNDGKINDGNELFGTKSGDGFKDLAAYDKNNDGKIDKNDPIFDKLRVWKPDASGNGQLIGLGEVGIGAIYLNAQSNEKIFESASGQTLGVQRKTAAYERTDGTLGGIHHIDLAKHQKSNESENYTNKAKGLASYRHSQGELDRLRFLNNQPTNANSEQDLKLYYEQMNSLLADTGFFNTNKDQIVQKIDNIKKGNISEEDLALIQLDMLMSKTSKTSFVSLLNNAVFEGELGQINSSIFEYGALLKAQRLLG